MRSIPKALALQMSRAAHHLSMTRVDDDGLRAALRAHRAASRACRSSGLTSMSGEHDLQACVMQALLDDLPGHPTVPLDVPADLAQIVSEALRLVSPRDVRLVYLADHLQEDAKILVG